MNPDPRTGLFSSSLVPQPPSEHETKNPPAEFAYKNADNKAWEKRADGQAYVIQPATPVETAFRHGLWAQDRERVIDGLRAANVPAARLEKFLACGSNCLVEYSPSTERYRVRASYCHDRFCKPCMVSKAKKLKENLLEWTQGQRVRFGTVTLEKTSQSLQDKTNHLLESFKKLRRQKFWKESVRAGIAIVEVTRGKKRDHWHVHLHFLIVGNWLDVDALREGWREASGGSFIVDIRSVQDHEVGVGYIAAYAGKGWDQTVLEDHDALIECIVSMRGRRLCFPFGDWYGRDDQLCKAQPNDWKRIERLGIIYRDAVAGEIWALTVFRALGYAAGGTDERPAFVGAVLPWSGP